jgi:hypothetical protein
LRLCVFARDFFEKFLSLSAPALKREGGALMQQHPSTTSLDRQVCFHYSKPYERGRRLKKSQSDQERNFNTIVYRPLVPLAGLRSRRKERQDFVFYRIGTDDSVNQSALRAFRENDYVGHTEKNNGCFFESSVPIRKRLCALGDLYVERKNKHIKKRGVGGVSPHIEKCP